MARLYRVRFTTDNGRREWATEREYVVDQISKPEDLLGWIYYRESLSYKTPITIWNIEEFPIDYMSREWTRLKNGAFKLFENDKEEVEVGN